MEPFPESVVTCRNQIASYAAVANITMQLTPPASGREGRGGEVEVSGKGGEVEGMGVGMEKRFVWSHWHSLCSSYI